MPKKAKKKHNHGSKKVFTSPFNIYWERNNYYLLFAGIALIILGFYLMSIGPWNSFVSLVISPIVLVFGYTIVIPTSIFYRKKNSMEDSKENDIATGKS
jgi:membrane protein YdbS with pleckstrin-like domain